ncbi:hypothetical protein K438DRAFT_1798889 [Mycena galopus ATCC 62051]|nr:hypothetical protein K438DRAFT_1798889 [Mycena galopus ATCC 62051]
MLVHLAADRALVVNLDAKILDLERSLFALRTEKELVQERLDSFKYPVLALPNEITTEIFTHFVPPYPDCPQFVGPDSPTLLTQICHEWREIALGTPTLWRAMTPSDRSISSDRCVHLCEAWLHRSRSCPLSLSLEFGYLDRAPQILSALVLHRARWEYLDLRLYSSHLPAIEGPMPLLRFTLQAEFFSKVVLPLGQVTSLTLKAVSRSEYAVILRQTCNLVQCELDVWYDRGAVDDLPPDNDIELPCLESFVFRNQDVPWTIAAGYLADFRLPALRSLQLAESFLEPEPIDALASFISKSGCTLQVCFLSRDPLLAPFREAFPSIRFFCRRDSDAARISSRL